MIEHIHTLKPEVAAKRIYVWDIGKFGLRTFARLAYRGFDVEGFVTTNNAFAGECIMNRPVVTPEEFAQMPNAIAILDDEFGERSRKLAASTGNTMRISDAFTLNPKLGDYDLYLCALTDCWMTLRELREYEPRVKAILQTTFEGIPHIAGLPIRPFDAEGLGDKDAVVISPCFGIRAAGIAALLQTRGYRGTIFVREFVPFDELMATDPFVTLDYALKTGRRILTCFDDPQAAQLINDLLARYGVSVARSVAYEHDPLRELDDIWALADEDPAECTLLVHAGKSSRLADIREAAHDLGFRIEDGSLAGMRRLTYRRWRLTDEIRYERDTLVGVSIDYTPLGGLPGWAVFGDPEGPGRRIMVLGGSTSAEVYFSPTWVEHLYRLLRANGIEAVVFNGGHEANGVAAELDRLARDIDALKPDLVISMSGINDMRPPDTKFDELSHADPFEYWKHMEERLKTVVESSGAAFLPILQPINSCMDEYSLHELMLFIHQANMRNPRFKLARDDDFYLNLLRLLHHQKGSYVDCCHYSDAGAARIAEAVYEAIREVL